MDQRIVEILMFVLGEIQSRQIKGHELDGISDDLLQRGFTRREVATAFSLIADRLGRDVTRVDLNAHRNLRSFRVLDEVERQFISPEAFGHLLQLNHLGILTYTDVEELIERCMMIGNLGVVEDEMKMLIANHLIDKGPGVPQLSYIVQSINPETDWIH